MFHEQKIFDINKKYHLHLLVFIQCISVSGVQISQGWRNKAVNTENLLLSQQAEIDTKPQLEIYADDVKCAHGSTVGQLDKDALFYMQARSISKQQATALLTRAFLAEAFIDSSLQRVNSSSRRNAIDRSTAVLVEMAAPIRIPSLLRWEPTFSKRHFIGRRRKDIGGVTSVNWTEFVWQDGLDPMPWDASCQHVTLPDRHHDFESTGE